MRLRKSFRFLQYPLAGLFLYNCVILMSTFLLLILQYPLAGLFLYNLPDGTGLYKQVVLAVPSSGPIPLQLCALVRRCT